MPEIAVGILLCSCVPGGGLGHLIVLITGTANTELSVAINFLQIFVPLGMLTFKYTYMYCLSVCMSCFPLSLNNLYVFSIKCGENVDE